MRIDPERPWRLYDKEIILKITGENLFPWASISEGKITTYDSAEDAFVIRISKAAANASEIMQFARVKGYGILELQNSFFVMLKIATNKPGTIREIVKARFAKADMFQITNGKGEIFWRIRLMKKSMGDLMSKFAIFSSIIEPEYSVYIDYIGDPQPDADYLKAHNVKDSITDIEIIQKSKPSYRKRMPQYFSDFHQEWKFLSRADNIEEIRFSMARTESSSDLKITASMKSRGVYVTEETMKTPIPTFFMGSSIKEGISPLILYNDYVDGVQKVRWLVMTEETGGLIKRIAMANTKLGKMAKFVITKYALLDI